jgi:4-hydroxybenzoate polyprenyltransferase
MAALTGLVRATHPLPALAVTVLVGAVTAARGADPATVALVVGSTGTGQASIGWSNDYLDRHLDAAAGRREKPLVAGDIHPSTVWWAALAALPLSLGLSMGVGLAEAAVMLAAVSAAWAYNLGVKATPLSAFPYTVAFGLAPVYIWLATSDSLPPGWIVVAGALLGTAAHLLNALPDFESDRAASTVGIVHRLGFRRSLFVACAVLAALLALVLLEDGAAPTPAQLVAAAAAAGLIVAIAVAGVRGAPRAAFRLTILAAAAIVATFALSPAVH